MLKKKLIGWIIFLCVMFLCCSACAEISTNLRKETTYTRNNKILTQSFVDSEGNTVMAEDLGYATLVNTYTSGNKLVQTEYLDAAGNPVNNAYGFSVRRLTYAMKKIRLEEFLDTEGNPAPGPQGYARCETDWEQGKKHIETRYYDPEGNLFRSDRKSVV